VKIRFRVWDGCRMFYPEDEANPNIVLGQKGLLYGDMYGLEELDCDFVAMLSTARKDLDGKEIFAEDIIDGGDNYPSVVRFGESDWNEGLGFYLEERGEDGYYRCHTLDAYTTTPTILGNVHENPDIVGVTK
jgi:hypothetical protein